MIDSTPLLTNPALLRARYEADGYVLFRGIAPLDKIGEIRDNYFERFPREMFAAGSNSIDGIFSGEIPPTLPEYGTPGHPAYELVRTHDFKTFATDREFTRISDAILQGPTEILPRQILRTFCRGVGTSTRAHVDFDYSDMGTDQIVTAWIPLGDCPIEAGGLIYLEGSHQADRRLIEQVRRSNGGANDPRPISADLNLTARVVGGRWLWADFRPGDVAFHSPHMIHAALDNQTEKIRLSTDIRFKRAGAETDERWVQAWSAIDGF